MDSVIPREVLQDSLRKFYKDDNMEILRVDITEPSHLKGEHFASIIEYVDVTIKTKMETKIVYLFRKRGLITEEKNPLGETMKIAYMKEEKFYVDILPIFIQLSKSTITPSNLDFIPQIIYIKEDVVLMENIVKQYDFKMDVLNLTIGQDWDQIKIVLNSLSHFHAMSFVLKHRKEKSINELFPCVLENVLFTSTVRNIFGGFVTSSLTRMAQIALETEGYQDIGKCFEKFVPHLFDAAKEAMCPEEPFNVICHGDIWNNNILFHYDKNTGKPDQVKIVDYQIIRYVPLTCDIMHYLCSSTNVFYRLENIEMILQYYYDRLKTHLSLYNINNLFSFEMFFEDYQKRLIFGLMFSAPFIVHGFMNKSTMPEGENIDEQFFVNMDSVCKDTLRKPEIKAVVVKQLAGFYVEVQDNILRYLNKVGIS